MTTNPPKISVVTVVRNAAGELEKTIKSVLGQDYPLIEFIVIDGGSSDGTVEVIRTYAGQMDYWISEPDQGIYDAMNKGLVKTTGEWVNFMNAGDVFFNNHVLSSIFNQELNDAQVLYGDSVAQYPAFKAWRKALPQDDIRKGMICCHQAMFFQTKLIRDKAYQSDLYFSADYEMVLRLFHAGFKFRYIPETIAVFDTRGTSNRKMVKSARSNLKILNSTGKLSLNEKRYHQRFICRAKATEWVYRVLPGLIMETLLKWIYRNQIVKESNQ
ncbi:MAG: glycosyltransferase family 2 protein [Bacteroidota bacterium]